MPLKIDVLANTRQVVSEMKKAGDSIEDITDALDDVAKDGKDASTKLERSFRDLASEAKDTGKDIKKGISGGLKETADEAKQSGKEAAASFSGEFSDVGDFLQETVAQGLGGFGPIGLAAGLAGAAGIGIVTAEITKQQEEAKALGEFMAGAYQKAADEGRKYIDAATIIGEAQDIIFNPDRQDEYNRTLEQANAIGLDANTLIRARAGDQDALNTVLAATAAKQDEVKTKAEAAGSTAIRLSLDEQRELQKIQGDYENIGELHKTNADNARRAQDIKNQLSEEERAQIQRTRAADQARYEALARQAGQGITIPSRVDLSQAERDVRDFRARAARRINIHVGASGLNQIG